MRTNIEIDDRLMRAVLSETGLPTKRAAVEAALNLLLRMRRQEQLLDLEGKIEFWPDYDPEECDDGENNDWIETSHSPAS